jgi:hypothetical protein
VTLIPTGGGELVRLLVYSQVQKAWVPLGDVLATDTTNYKQVVYEDGSTLYVCKAVIGAALSSAVWQVKKIVNMDITWADGDDNFDNVATDLNTVKALDYS